MDSDRDWTAAAVSDKEMTPAAVAAADGDGGGDGGQRDRWSRQGSKESGL